MKLFRKVVDERQELQMMRVERSSFYVLFFALGASLLVQIIMFGADMKQIVGEAIVLLLGVVWMVVGHIRNGSWGYYTKPGIKSYIVCSLATAFVYAIASSLYRYLRHNISLRDILPAVVINSTAMFVLMFIASLVLGSITKKRQKKLKDKYTEDE